MAACRATLTRPARCARPARAEAAAAPAPASPYLRLAADNPHISHAWALALPRRYEATRCAGGGGPAWLGWAAAPRLC